MGFWDNLTEKATNLAQSGAAASKRLAENGMATSKRLAEIAKLSAANLAEEGGIKNAYTELGKLYYAEHGATPEAGYAAACEKITAAKATIEANNARIAQLKAESEEVGEETAEEVQDAEAEEAPAGEAPAGEAPAAEEAPVEEAPAAEEAPAEEVKPEE